MYKIMSQAQEKALLRREGVLIWAFAVCAMGAELGRHSKEPLLHTGRLFCHLHRPPLREKLQGSGSHWISGGFNDSVSFGQAQPVCDSIGLQLMKAGQINCSGPVSPDQSLPEFWFLALVGCGLFLVWNQFHSVRSPFWRWDSGGVSWWAAVCRAGR